MALEAEAESILQVRAKLAFIWALGRRDGMKA